jgi:predicted MPP superfamily phosphohydrolase
MVPALVLAGAAATLAVYASIIAPRRLRIVELDVDMPGLDAAFDGYRIGVLSDLHQAALPGLAHTRRAMDEIQRRDPHLIALLGDYGVSFKHSRWLSARLYPRELEDLAPLIRGLRAPDGVVGLIGNHDYYYDGAAVAAWLESLGVRVLINEHVTIRRDGAVLTIAGVDDLTDGSPDIACAFEGSNLTAPRILLTHNPDVVLNPGNAPRPALVLAGHMHGGQVRFPVYGAPVRFAKIGSPRRAQGWLPNDYAPLFVSAGVGSQIPVRFGTVPDAVLVRLRARRARGDVSSL